MVTSIILAGGKSRRFGSDKTLLRWRGEGLVQHIAGECRRFSDEVLVVSNAPGKFGHVPGIRELSDIYPGSGPLGGIHAGLFHAKNATCFVTACDMPFFDVALARRLLEAGVGYDAAVPKENGKASPLFGVYGRVALPVAEAMLREGQLAVWRLCARLNTRYLAPEEWPAESRRKAALYNINRPEDLERLPEPPCNTDGTDE